ncbi:uncharacterized protein LOC108252010 isoform X1 [Diaphorina citri]|uniref:Uncharacterized protein LOC108252010 isoform X1 n=1 Tax=Diaphorina citri TaxID=121845 RepID=A0A3Q0IS09_DIACI|nr:uncharacterized protein LOC108252010 isoform X1 [Diaphorina citri]XP_026677130.1 uncharacterized protein LOC108252010 isoform X1 [Diaphorina citri]
MAHKNRGRTLYCCVTSCTSNRKSTIPNNTALQNDPEAVTFHQFPRNPERQTAWIEKCFGKDSNSKYLEILQSGRKTPLYICSKHFTPDDFTESFAYGELLKFPSKRGLKFTAVPSIDLPDHSQQNLSDSSDECNTTYQFISEEPSESYQTISNQNQSFSNPNTPISEKLRQLREEGKRRILQLIKENEELYKCPIHKVNKPDCSIENCVLRAKRSKKYESSQSVDEIYGENSVDESNVEDVTLDEAIADRNYNDESNSNPISYEDDPDDPPYAPENNSVTLKDFLQNYSTTSPANTVKLIPDQKKKKILFTFVSKKANPSKSLDHSSNQSFIVEEANFVELAGLDDGISENIRTLGTLVTPKPLASTPVRTLSSKSLEKVKKIDQLISENNLLISNYSSIDQGIRKRSATFKTPSEGQETTLSVESSVNKENSSANPHQVPPPDTIKQYEAKLIEQSELIKKLLDRVQKLEEENRCLKELEEENEFLKSLLYRESSGDTDQSRIGNTSLQNRSGNTSLQNRSGNTNLQNRTVSGNTNLQNRTVSEKTNPQNQSRKVDSRTLSNTKGKPARQSGKGRKFVDKPGPKSTKRNPLSAADIQKRLQSAGVKEYSLSESQSNAAGQVTARRNSANAGVRSDESRNSVHESNLSQAVRNENSPSQTVRNSDKAVPNGGNSLSSAVGSNPLEYIVLQSSTEGFTEVQVVRQDQLVELIDEDTRSADGIDDYNEIEELCETENIEDAEEELIAGD